MDLNEIYVGIKDKEYIELELDSLCRKYHDRQGPDYAMRRALFRSYCHDTLQVFNNCFESSLLGITRCAEKVDAYQKSDSIDIESAVYDIVFMLDNLKSIARSMVSIKDLPSCKNLTELSPEDIVAKSKNLIKSDIIKAGIGSALLGLKINDAVTIIDVRRYYLDLVKELNREIKEKNKAASSCESFLLEKFNAEIGYCNLAMFKTGIGITEELKDLVEIGKKHIEQYEAHQAAVVGYLNGPLVGS